MTAPIDKPKWQPFIAVALIIFGAWLFISKETISAVFSMSAGILLFTRLRVLSQLFLYLGMGVYLFREGLTESSYFALTFGSLLILVSAIGIIIGVIEAISHRTDAESLTRRN